jgi:membrane-associated phospholipid phosphatase
MCTFLFTGMTICLLIYTFFPNSQTLRIDYNALGRQNILIDWLAQLQAGDTPYNVFPSIHCLNSIGMNIAMAKNQWFKKHPWALIGITVLTISICLSTVFVKQHSILDM